MVKHYEATDPFIPRFQTGSSGIWKINAGGQLVNDWGYYSGVCLLEMLPSLARKTDPGNTGEGGWETWMSLTPHEIESQELGYQHACGHTVIMGLGMGWVAANAALNPNVSQVSVIEQDADVLSLFHDSGAFASIPDAARQKIAIVQADALEWQPAAGQGVDFLYVDIWLHLAEPKALQQVRQMQSHVQAAQVYYWGQEIAIYSALAQLADNAGSITDELIRQAVRDVVRLPLFIPRAGLCT
ncbi:MAG: hypothetical protein R3E89_06075 [Thiolinea sp.]